MGYIVTGDRSLVGEFVSWMVFDRATPSLLSEILPVQKLESSFCTWGAAWHDRIYCKWEKCCGIKGRQGRAQGTIVGNKG